MTRPSRRLPGRRDLGLAGLAALVILVLWILGWLGALERPASDLLLRLPRPGPAPATPFAAILIDDETIGAHGQFPWPRSRLARLVEAARAAGGSAVVLDMLLPEPGDPLGDRRLSRALAAGPSVLAAALQPDAGWLLPLEIFRQSSSLAHAHAEVGPDGVVRAVAASKQATGLALPALSVAAARLAGSRASYAPGQLLRPGFRIPPDRIPSLGAASLLQGEAADTLLTDRVVLVGLSAAGTGESFMVPTTGRKPPESGTLVHASVASSLVLGDLVRPLPLPGLLILVFLLALAVQLLRSRSGELRPTHLVLLVGAVAVTAPLCLWTTSVLLPTVSLVAAVPVSALLREGVESRQAQVETGRLLHSLVAELGHEVEVPAGASGRLGLVQRLQESLVRDRDLRRTLLESLTEGVVLWGGDGGVLMVNRTACHLWGDTPNLKEIQSLAEPTDEDRRALGRIQRRGHDLELEVLALEEGHLGVIRDVSEREELERRRREMQRLVAHELKTPLASLAGFGGMIERYDLSHEELQRVAGLIRSESERLGTMVSTFLDLERLRTDRWDGERTGIDLGGLVEERRRILAAAAAERQQEIVLEIAGSPRVNGVAELLARVVDNLLGNALKFSPAGSKVELAAGEVEGEAILEVTDRGPGIPPEALPHLFERFWRAPGSEAPGSGLGLALVKEVVEWHGGRVEVDSRQGRGACFRVVLPAGDDGRGRQGDASWEISAGKTGDETMAERSRS